MDLDGDLPVKPIQHSRTLSQIGRAGCRAHLRQKQIALYHTDQRNDPSEWSYLNTSQ